MANRLHYHPVPEIEPYYLSQRQTFDSNQGSRLTVQNFHERYCTLESSSPNDSYPVYNSLSTVPLSSDKMHHSAEINTYGSPVSGSCITDDMDDFKHKLQELETVMMGPDSDITESTYQNGTHTSTPKMDNLRQVMRLISKRDLKPVLIACARALGEGDSLTAQWLMDEVRQMVSVSGEPIQRLGAYMLEGLVARLASSGTSIYRYPRCKQPENDELLSYMHILFDVCPYLKFGYLSANGAIAEAMKDENQVHIIDFQIAQGSQWITLIQAFAARPSGPPHIRITGIDDTTSAYARGGGLSIVGKRLAKLAAQFQVPFEFHAAPMPGSEADLQNLCVRSGEALAVNFAFMLHHMPDESVTTENHRDRLLRLVKSLSPKVVTLVEQESNTNTAAFFPRFLETLDYYTAMFESIDVTLPRDHKDRINVEQHCLARGVVNIIACEGVERAERHELLGKWKSRFRMAGFTPYPLSGFVNSTIKMLLENYSDRYRLQEKDEALYLGWMNRDLVASCAWK
ncbi:hypothetical protein ACFE04_031220 [Oxalis oulophora]